MEGSKDKFSHWRYENVWRCENCKHYEPFNGVCCNAKSEWVADFRDEDDDCINFEEGAWKHEQKTKKKPD